LNRILTRNKISFILEDIPDNIFIQQSFSLWRFWRRYFITKRAQLSSLFLFKFDANFSRKHISSFLHQKIKKNIKRKRRLFFQKNAMSKIWHVLNNFKLNFDLLKIKLKKQKLWKYIFSTKTWFYVKQKLIRYSHISSN